GDADRLEEGVPDRVAVDRRAAQRIARIEELLLAKGLINGSDAALPPRRHLRFAAGRDLLPDPRRHARRRFAIAHRHGLGLDYPALIGFVAPEQVPGFAAEGEVTREGAVKLFLDAPVVVDERHVIVAAAPRSGQRLLHRYDFPAHGRSPKLYSRLTE